MTIGYKLTDKDHQTYNNTQWGEDITHTTDGIGDLCGPGWLHYYQHPLLAVLHNPIHAYYKPFVLWECEINGELLLYDGMLKSGCTSLTTLKIIDAPIITTVQRTAYGIFCALEVYSKENFVVWANNWLNNIDRSYAAAAKWAAEWAAAEWAAAEWAAWGAAAEWAVEAAARAAEKAVHISKDLNLIAISEKAMQYQ